VDSKLSEIVEALLAKPTEALRQTQRLLRHGAKDDILERMKLESSLFAERLASEEVKQAISAFFETRNLRA
jgi:enoyl-CoA hydratase/carnithine racemase